VFTGITPEICATAWSIIEPAIVRASDLGVTNRPGGNLVVLDPASAAFSILFTAHTGEPSETTLGYATAKAKLVLRTGRDTSTLRNAVPHLYQPEDIKFPGGIFRDGLIVAFSGVQGEYDEMISEWFVSAVRAICRVAFNGPDGDGQPTPYLGREG